MQGIDADQFEAQFARCDTGQLQPFADDLQRQSSARERAGAGIGDLPLADIAVDIADRDFQRIGAFRTAPAADAHAIGCDFLDPHLREIRNHVGLEISGGIVHLVEQLLLAGLRRHRAAGAFDLGDDETAVFTDLADGKAEPREIGNILVAGIGKIAAGDLAGAFQQMPGDGALPEQIPVVHRPAEGMDHRRQEQRRIGRAAGDDDIGARRSAPAPSARRRDRRWPTTAGCRAALWCRRIP